MGTQFSLVRGVLEKFGIAVTRPDTIRQLSLDRRELLRTRMFHKFLQALTPEAMALAVQYFPQSHSENFQDIFTLLVLGSEKDKYFVEFGATNGVDGSNTYMLEKSVGWNGVLAEPARVWWANLAANRKAKISHDCVWSEDGQRLLFREARDGGFSTLETFWARDRHASKRSDGRTYEVETITLDKLLSDSGAPATVEYLSMDTEGSEYEIIRNFDFDRWRISVITVEHNYREEREKIFRLLSNKNYSRAPIGVSLYDDWYVSSEYTEKMKELFRPDVWEPSRQSPN